jgi:hypothetical protein
MPTQRTTSIKITAQKQAIISHCVMGITISEKYDYEKHFYQCILDAFNLMCGYDPDFMELFRDKVMFAVDYKRDDVILQFKNLIETELYVKVFLL